jgi:hypothetical protein
VSTKTRARMILRGWLSECRPPPPIFNPSASHPSRSVATCSCKACSPTRTNDRSIIAVEFDDDKAEDGGRSIDRSAPTDPVESIDWVDSVDSIDSVDSVDSIDSVDLTPSIDRRRRPFWGAGDEGAAAASAPAAAAITWSRRRSASSRVGATCWISSQPCSAHKRKSKPANDVPLLLLLLLLTLSPLVPSISSFATSSTGNSRCRLEAGAYMLAAASCPSSCAADDTAQTDDWHAPDRQSPVPVQARPIAQRGHAAPKSGGPPPQSASVSWPFFTPSLQVGAAHRPSAPHTPDAQDAAEAHRAPVPQSGHAPSQSTSASAPLRTPSVHVGTAHTEILSEEAGRVERSSPALPNENDDDAKIEEEPHTPLVQSPAAEHALPGGQRGQSVPTPPQSTSASSPLRTSSSHAGAWQVPTAASGEVPLPPPPPPPGDEGEQTPEVQSAEAVQVLATGHRGQPLSGAPQSTSTSRAFLTPSEHVGAIQKPSVQTPDAQSAGAAQPRPVTQSLSQPLPLPQSMPVSSPFATPSLQVGAAQRPLSEQTPDRQSLAAPHVESSAHASGQSPPQSASVSEGPFFTPSLQVGAAQTPLAEQTLEAQSVSSWQSRPSAQASHPLPRSAPPQSASVSSPFFTPSTHAGATQWPMVEQTPDAQSLANEQAASAPQGPHPVDDAPPPQSTSVSEGPFFTPSEQVGAAQVPLLPVPPSSDPVAQTPDEQSPSEAQDLAAAQRSHVRPPQSTSVSSPFLTPSSHVGASQMPSVEQTPESQSASPTLPSPAGHAFPGAHAGHTLPDAAAPPQSASVSPPFLTPSSQVGAAHHPSAPHTPEAQSAANAHVEPPSQRSHLAKSGTKAPSAAPPQSTSASSPFLTLSEQVGAKQTP